jgi:hypothetical protein
MPVNPAAKSLDPSDVANIKAAQARQRLTLAATAGLCGLSKPFLANAMRYHLPNQDGKAVRMSPERTARMRQAIAVLNAAPPASSPTDLTARVSAAIAAPPPPPPIATAADGDFDAALATLRRGGNIVIIVAGAQLHFA